MQTYNYKNPSSSSPMMFPSWVILAAGFVLGQRQYFTQPQTQAINEDEELPVIFWPLEHNLYGFVDTVVVPLYTTLVLLYLSLRFLQSQNLLPQVPRYPGSFVFGQLLGELTSTDDEDEEDEEEEDDKIDQPVNLSGLYKLIKTENFDAFLEVQGVPWPLRKAACKARPVNRITHKGSKITLRMEGIITTETTYKINGPPVEINIRGRRFMDRVVYSENGNGILGIKTAITENYDVSVERQLSEDKQQIVLTSRAVFKDEREPIETRQIFQRIG